MKKAKVIGVIDIKFEFTGMCDYQFGEPEELPFSEQLQKDDPSLLNMPPIV